MSEEHETSVSNISAELSILTLDRMTEQCIEEEALHPRKRPRVSRSDSEDDILNEALSELGDSPKRRCFEVKEDVYQNLEPSEQIKSPPKPCLHKMRSAKPDTPAFPSVIKCVLRMVTRRQKQCDLKDDSNDADCPHPVQCSTPLVQHVKSGSVPGVSRDWQADVDSAPDPIFSTPSVGCIVGKGQLVERVLEMPSKHEVGEDAGGVPGAPDSAVELGPVETGCFSFRSVLEKFEFRSEPDTPSSCSFRPCSLFTSTRAIQEKLLNSTFPSTFKEGLLRKERREELSLLRAQYKKDNLWLQENGAGSGFWETSWVIPQANRVTKRIKRNLWPPSPKEAVAEVLRRFWDWTRGARDAVQPDLRRGWQQCQVPYRHTVGRG
ncbi:hypothetical protein AOXY_G18365 [Acipenser oxyrinchus oxyrinchus]|uniref:Uncharacterized protein n=1 Tax=Acipenser oxyrinchus oxyrinchus TaxID=40147 RepID=A0AAD8D3Y4_ACIOX|nr:hypothetical protein AOXY_G18365 [Acipenser oxyrinchus oxyrinchus]